MSTSPWHNGKDIITCAITGSIHTPSMSPHLPVTPNDIIDSASEAAEAGQRSSIFTPATPILAGLTSGLRRSSRFLYQATNAVVNLTSGGSLHDDRRAHPTLHPLQAGTRLPEHGFDEVRAVVLNRFKAFKHDWEPQYLESTRDLVFRNTFKDIEYAVTALSANGTRFEFECTTSVTCTTSLISRSAS